MKGPIRPNATWRFITPDDLSAPPEDRTVFVLEPLTVEQRMNAWDNLNWLNDDGTIQPRGFREALSLCLTNVKDVENFHAPKVGTSEESPEYELVTFPKDAPADQKRAFFSRMRDLDLILVGNEIRTRSTMGIAEKNSLRPAPILT